MGLVFFCLFGRQKKGKQEREEEEEEQGRRTPAEEREDDRHMLHGFVLGRAKGKGKRKKDKGVFKNSEIEKGFRKKQDKEIKKYGNRH